MNSRTIIWVMVTVFLILAGSWSLQRSWARRIETLRENRKEIEIRNLIYNDLVGSLRNCKALLFQAPLSSTTPGMFQHYLQQIHQKFSRVRNAFKVLEEGGEYRRVIPLNRPDRSSYQMRYRLRKGMEIPPQLSPDPQLKLLQKKIADMDRTMNELFSLQAKESGALRIPRDLRLRMAITVKELDAIYRRLIENINELLYLDEASKKEILLQRDRLSVWQLYLQLATLASVLILVLLMGLLSMRRLSRLNQELKKRLYVDRLTGLKSRAALEERGVGTQEGVLLIDILNFREINDLYGMRTGDAVLKKVAERLEEICRSTQLYHLGGNTFALLWSPESLNNDKTAESFALEKIDALQRYSYLANGVAFHLRFSGGVAWGERGVDRAMIALDEAKQRNLSVVVYAEEKRDFLHRIQKTREMQHLIHQAIERERVVPFVQPIVDREGRWSKYELLMRVEYGRGLYTLPDFEVAIAGRMYGMLSRQMIHKSFALMRGRPLSLNLNYEDMCDEETIALLETLVQERDQGDPPVTFEILENISITDFGVVRRFIKRFRDRGVLIAIDDFGSDYSNLFRILQLSPDSLKIDGSLIRSVVESPEAYEAVRSIVGYAKNLRIKTVAEFVRNETIHRQCLELGIDYFQGFYFHRPFPASSLERIIEEERYRGNRV